MKRFKISAVLLSTCLALGALAGCSQGSAPASGTMPDRATPHESESVASEISAIIYEAEDPEDAAAEAGLAIVHGAICGWDLQAMLVPPGSGLLHQMYPEGYTPASKTSLPVTPAICAAIEASTAIRYLCGLDVPLEKSLLIGSIADMSFDIIHFAD